MYAHPTRLLFSWIASFGTFQALMWIKRANISTTSQTSLDYMILYAWAPVSGPVLASHLLTGCL